MPPLSAAYRNGPLFQEKTAEKMIEKVRENTKPTVFPERDMPDNPFRALAASGVLCH
jgi:hypothetical protein